MRVATVAAAAVVWGVVLVVASAGSSYAPAYSDLSRWTCTKGVGEVRLSGCSRDGGPCLAIVGNSTNSGSCVSPALPFAPLTTLSLSAAVKCNASVPPGTHLMGVSGTNIDLVAVTGLEELGGGWTRYHFVLQLAGHRATRQISVGQWRALGSCLFAEVEAWEVSLAFPREPGVGPLGRSETLRSDGTYTATLAGSTELFGVGHRTVTNWTAYWNTNRFSFLPGTFLQADFGLETPFVSTPSLSINVGYYTAGVMKVLSSADGVSWTEVAYVSRAGISELTLPQASHTKVKFLSTNGTLQFTSVTWSAKTAHARSSIGQDIALWVAPTSNETSISVQMNETALETSRAECAVPLVISLPTGTSISLSANRLVVPAGTRVTVVLSVGFPLSTRKVERIRLRFADISSQQDPVIVARGELLVSNNRYFALDEGYGELLDTRGGAALWWCGSTYKVGRDRDPPPVSTVTDSAKVSAARNEKEPFQVVLRAGSAPLVVTSVVASDLVSAGGAVISSESSISVRSVMYVVTRIPTDHYGRAGMEFPDPLIPMEFPITCHAHSNCVFWVLISVGQNVSAGLFRGNLTLSTNEGTLIARVQLRVFDFAIPKHTKLRSHFGLYPNDLNLYHRVGTVGAAAETVWDKYLESFSQHRLSPQAPTYHHPIKASFVLVNGTHHWAFNWTDFDAHYAKYFGEDGFGFNALQTGFKGMGWRNSTGFNVYVPINKYMWGTPDFVRLFKEYAVGVQDHLESLGILQYAYAYWYDEPETKDYPFVHEHTELLKSAAPKVQTFITEQMEDQLAPMDIWCPPQARYDSAKLHARQALGEHVWTYLCCCPTAPHLGIFIDRPAIELRLWLWLVFKEDIEGILLWETTFWTGKSPAILQNPYEDTMGWSRSTSFGNGDGRFLYPPLHYNESAGPLIEGPVESVRWEILREGIEDWEYLTLLRRLLAAKPATAVPDDVRAQAEALLVVPPSMLEERDVRYAWDPRELLSRRDAIGDLLEQLTTGRFKSSSSSIPNNAVDSALVTAELRATSVMLIALLAIVLVCS